MSSPDERVPLEPPTRADLARYAAYQRLQLSDTDFEDEIQRVSNLLRTFDRLGELVEPEMPLRYSHRDPGREPQAGEDPYNAVVRFCEVTGSGTGPLVGKRIGVKDNIAVACVPMTGGSRIGGMLVPVEDAVVVERLLGAGATITAKTTINLEAPAEFGSTRNPHNPRYWSGGSSSGSAAAVASGMVDAALGADQGGSIRVPSAWCGLVGMKATHGLVPSYGLDYWDHTLDHIGPMTATVADNATILEVVAGGDWRDPQWVRADPVAADYHGAKDVGVKGLRIGVVTESLEPAGCTNKTLATFERAQRTLGRMGARTGPVSVPLWLYSPTIWSVTLAVGLTAMDNSLGVGYGHLGRIDTHRLAASGSQHLLGTRRLPFGGHTFPLAVEHLRYAYNGVPLAKAHNLRLELRRQVDAALGGVDLLITPTTPTGPSELPTNQPTHTDSDTGHDVEGSPLNNCCAANLTGHPALTVPAGTGDNDLPAGLQIIGRKFDEPTVYRAGFALENAGS